MKKCIALLLALLMLPIAGMAAAPTPEATDAPLTEEQEAAYKLLDEAIITRGLDEQVALILQAAELAGDDPEILADCAQLIMYLDTEGEYTKESDDLLARAVGSSTPGDTTLVTLQALAEKMIFEGRTDEAIALVEEELAKNPTDNALRLTMATVLYYSEQDERAVEILEDLLEDSPEDLEALKLRAAILVDAGQWEEALQAYRQIDERHPEYLDGLIGLYLTYVASGNFEYGVRTIDQLINFGAGDEMWLERARVRLWKQYMPEQALGEAEALLRSNPEWLEAAGVKIGALLMLERYDEARETAETMRDADPEYTELLLALIDMNEDKWVEADTRLRELTTKVPTYYSAWRNLSAVQLGGFYDLDAAMDAIVRAFTYAGGEGDMDMYLQLGNVYRFQSNLPEAARSFLTAKLLTWDDPQPLYSLAMVYLDAGRKDDFIDTVETMEKTYPGWYETMLARVALEDALGNAEAALEAYAPLEQKFPFRTEQVPDLEVILRVRAGQGTAEEVAAVLDIEGENKDDAEAWDQYAYQLLFLGDIERAEAALAKAVALIPEPEPGNGGLVRDLNVAVIGTRMELCLAKGDIDGCVEQLREGMTLDYPFRSLELNPRFDELTQSDAYKALVEELGLDDENWDMTILPTIPN